MSAAELKAQGNAALQAKKYDEAIDFYTQAIALDDTNHVFFSNRSAAKLSSNDAAGALEDAEACIKLNSTWPKGYVRKGQALHHLRQYQEAVTAYEEGLKIEPGNASLTSGIQEVKRAVDAHNARVNQANQAAAGMGGMGGMQQMLAAAFGPQMFPKLAANEKTAEYLKDPQFQQTMASIQSDPNTMQQHMSDPRVIEALSVLMQSQADPEPFRERGPAPAPARREEKKEEKKVDPLYDGIDESKMSEEELAELENKREARRCKERGNELYKAKNYDEALAAYDEAAAKDGTDMTFILNKAAVYMSKKEYDQAITVANEAIELGRANRAAFDELAKGFRRIGKANEKKRDFEAAIAAYESAQLESHDKATERTIKKLQLEQRKAARLAYIDPEKAQEHKEAGNVHFRAGAWPQALAEYEEAVKRDPNSAPLRNNLAAALTKLMDFNGAKAAVDKALELDETYVKAWARKGDIEFFMKEYHKALESYQRGLGLEDGNAACRQGIQKTMQAIQSSQSSGEVDMDRARRGMADPEIQGILNDPMIRSVLESFQTNPTAAQEAMRDPEVAGKINKLIQAGVVQTK